MSRVLRLEQRWNLGIPLVATIGDELNEEAFHDDAPPVFQIDRRVEPAGIR
jgi:hypothetical protein